MCNRERDTMVSLRKRQKIILKSDKMSQADINIVSSRINQKFEEIQARGKMLEDRQNMISLRSKSLQARYKNLNENNQILEKIHYIEAKINELRMKIYAIESDERFGNKEKINELVNAMKNIRNASEDFLANFEKEKESKLDNDLNFGIAEIEKTNEDIKNKIDEKTKKIQEKKFECYQKMESLKGFVSKVKNSNNK